MVNSFVSPLLLQNCTSNTTWARTSEECTATELYNGGMCAKHLTQLQLCVTGHEEDGGVLVGDSNNTELAHQFMKSVGKLLKKLYFAHLLK